MKKITVFIKNHTLLFKYRTNKPVGPNLLNTNVISNNELVFSDEYLRENVKIVGLFILDLAKEREIDEIVVSNNEIGELVVDILKKLPVVNCFTITDDDTLSYALCEKICKAKNIKTINCYGIPQFMIEMLDKQGIDVESRYEVLFTSNFMADNNLTSFSKIYYKKSINIGEVLVKEDLDDINTFIFINKYLKVIHLETYSKDNLEKVIQILVNNKCKNITIQVHDDLENVEAIEHLRSLNKELSKKKIKISLVYSKDYLERNYLQQVIFTTLKICAILIFAIILSVSGYLVYNNFQSNNKVNQIKDELNKLMAEDSPDEYVPTEEDSGDGFKIINSYNKLLQVNSDMVGWLTIPNTKVDYPIVRATDNSFYLNRNFYKEDDYNGWAFMDYRNNVDILDTNTIIYAHNRYTSGVMFGTLPNMKKKGWFDKDENHYMTFNSLYKNMKWQVFSYYTVSVTNDYLKTNFESDKENQEFIDMLVKRSAKKFGAKVEVGDKILTLSTCIGEDKRFVVHAVLLDE